MKSCFLSRFVLFTGLMFAQSAPAVQPPLSRIEIVAKLATGAAPERMVWQVQNRGIDFVPDANFLSDLKLDHAEDAFIDALKSARMRQPDATASGPEAARREITALSYLHVAAIANPNGFHRREAEPNIRAAVAAVPGNPFVHLAMGRILGGWPSNPEQIVEFRKAVELQPNLAEAHMSLGQSLLDSDRQEGLAQIKQAVDLAPADGMYHLDYGRALERAGNSQAGAEQEKLASDLGYSILPTRIRVGGSVMTGKRISAKSPKYPPEALAAGIAGSVRMTVRRGRDGAVKDVELISGDPALADAAMNAVLKWRFKPTTLNGQPVEVETEVDVNIDRSR